MKIKKIDIRIQNRKNATDVSMLVDKPEFLIEIQRLRQKWDIVELYPLDDLEAFYANVMYKKPGLIQGYLIQFSNDISEILRKFHRDFSFRKVVEAALLAGEVNEHTYRRCYFDIVTLNEKADPNNIDLYQYVIVMSPRTEKKEVEEAYNEFQNFLRGFSSENPEENIPGKIGFYISSKENSPATVNDIEEAEYFVRGSIYDAFDVKKFKDLRELERTREWYWMRYGDKLNDSSKKLVSYPKILSDWAKMCPINGNHPETDESYKKCPHCFSTGVNDIEKAVSTYIKLLKQS